MSQPYVGQIILVGFNFAPTGYALCQGQLLPIAENDVLFQLIGTTFGGDGQSTFGLPDLRGRVPIGMGQGPGLGSRVIGEAGGAETVTLAAQEMPQHTHAIDISALTATARCQNGAGNRQTPVGNVPAVETVGATVPYSSAAPDGNMNSGAVALSGTVAATTTGGTQPHDNRQPYLAMNYCIALTGVFPPSN
jgi:microcystin-dependent protein